MGKNIRILFDNIKASKQGCFRYKQEIVLRRSNMALRPAWTIKDGKVVGKEFEFQWNGGFAITQKQKNIKNLHQSIEKSTGDTALEISSKSLEPIGAQLSAFELKIGNKYLENIFQSSKKYENGGPYLDLLNVAPKDAKRDERHKNSGRLISFIQNGIEWPLEPKTAFYDYIYALAVMEKYGKSLDLSKYSWFTDIEFNPSKSINCQARAIAIYKLIQDKSAFDVLKNKDEWIDFHISNVVL